MDLFDLMDETKGEQLGLFSSLEKAMHAANIIAECEGMIEWRHGTCPDLGNASWMGYGDKALKYTIVAQPVDRYWPHSTKYVGPQGSDLAARIRAKMKAASLEEKSTPSGDAIVRDAGMFNSGDKG
jgi:hypothetical protein